jgi:tetratricopeptide (TPR) repeat protein
VEGSVRRGTKTVRVTAQLLDARDGKHLWAETFDRDLSVGELFAVQDEITAQIVGAIAGSYGAISRTRFETAVAAGTANLEAYDCVLQAYAYEQKLTPDVHAATRDCLERAVTLDPAYAAAWSKLAFLYADEYAFGYNPRPGSLDRALEAAQRAVDLNPSSGMTHWHLARTHFWRNEVQEAVAVAERALALSPNNAFILAAAGTYVAPTSGDNLKRGMQLTSKALHIDPNGPGWYHVPEILFYYNRQEYEAALAASLKMNMPRFFHTHVWRTAIYGQLGRSNDAAASREKLLQLYPTYPENARRELKKFNVYPALADHVIDGLRKGGLEIAEEAR